MGEKWLIEPDTLADESKSNIVGLSLVAEEVSLPNYKEWERRERSGKLRNMLNWKVTNNQTHAVSHRVVCTRT